MAADPKARKFSINWAGGYLTATRGLLEAIYGPTFMDTVGAGKAKSIAVKGHQRVRVIGGPTTTITPHSYGVIDYPRKVKGGAAGGQAIKIQIEGSWWSARLGGSIQDFKAFLAGVGKPKIAFVFSTERGGEYSSSN
jgi:hypothetical protein